MFKKLFILVLLFLNIISFEINCVTNIQTTDFMIKVDSLKKKGLNLTQIYDQLKLKNESFKSFNERLQKAMYGESKTPSPATTKNGPVINYPYQSAQNYNPKYVIDDYYFLGDINVYGEPTDRWVLRDVNGRVLANIDANKTLSMSPTVAGKKNDIYADMQRYKVTDKRSIGYILESVNGKWPEVRIFIEKKGNIITMYIGNPSIYSTQLVMNESGKRHRERVMTTPGSGLKLIFDADKFREDLTQTYFYKELLDSKNYQVVGFGLGFSVDPTQPGFLSTTNISQIVNILNIKLIYKITDLITGMPGPIYDSEPLSNQYKIKEENYNELIKYADLFATGAISIEPLNDDDIKKLNEIR